MESEEKNKLYVGNLPYGVDDESFKELFAGSGEVADAKVITDKYSGRSRGFGFVTMADEAGVKKAIDEMNNREVEGRALVVNISRPREKREFRS